MYDTYHPILEYTNYAILGITAALAWELPSRPVYLNEELRESYEMGNLPLINRHDQNVSNVNYTSTVKRPSTNATNSNENAYSNYYYTNVQSPTKQNPFNKFYATKPYQQFYYDLPDKHKYSNSIAGNVDSDTDQSNKLQYYLSYADKFMKEFKEFTQKLPKDRPLGPGNLKDLADRYCVSVILYSLRIL